MSAPVNQEANNEINQDREKPDYLYRSGVGIMLLNEKKKFLSEKESIIIPMLGKCRKVDWMLVKVKIRP